MWVSYDRPTIATWGLDVNLGTRPTFVTSSSYLMDSKVSVPTRIAWGSSVTTSTQIVVAPSFSSSPLSIADGEYVVFALLCPKTSYAIPSGVLVSFLISDGTHPISGSGSTVDFNNGATGVIIAFKNTLGFTLSGSIGQVNIHNTGGWVTASGQNIDIGEIWFGTMQEFKTATDVQYGLVDPTTNRRSHNNNPWPLFRKPYRTLSATIQPLTDSEAYSGANNFDAFRVGLSKANAALFLPRIYTRGTTTQDTDAINQLAMFGRVDSIDPLVGVRNGNGLWTARLSASETPP